MLEHCLTKNQKIRMLLSKNQWQKGETLDAGCVHVHCWVHGLVWCALGMCTVGDMDFVLHWSGALDR